MTSIFNTWLERIEAEHIQHHQVIQLYAAVYPLAQGYRPRGKRTNLRKAEAQAIMARIYERARNGNGLRATADNEERGRDWLHANRRKLGLPDSFDARSIIEFRLVGARAPEGPDALGEEGLRIVEGLGLRILAEGEGDGAAFGRIGQHRHGAVERGDQLFGPHDAVEVA